MGRTMNESAQIHMHPNRETTQTGSAKRVKIEFANTLRGVAAMLVLISHYLGVFWTNRDAVSRYTLLPPLPKNFSTPTLVEWLHFSPWINWGALGVGLFFLISGFVIPFSLLNRNRFSFAIARAFRLLPTYAAGFTVTLIILFLGTNLSGIEWPFSNPDIMIHYIPGLRDHFQTPNIDGIIWTLEVEVKFYIVAAILSSFFINKTFVIVLMPLILTVFQKSYFIVEPTLESWHPMIAWVARPFALSAQFMCLMFIGATLHLLFTKKISRYVVFPSILVHYILFSYLWSDFQSNESIGAFLGYSASIPIFFICMRLGEYFRPHPITAFFADISYPLYVVHAVAGYILMYALLLRGWDYVPAILAATLSSVAIATAIHHVIELPSQAVGRRYARRIGYRKRRFEH
ncbi:acyltransferase [Devosia rhodophyticola]|uniref:Acyltransferase n=1 Tax=Devosia rhodophyticola TaxID=3026423 RepID=A0ABY7Z0Z8_9HYPH|nr:acyltransferase [Devosia rhodophyticola]WDR07286.1 acyltransferase [Devosia rhodophyticola]